VGAGIALPFRRQGGSDLWCADFQGEFKLGNSQYCYPLTVTDHASRYLLMCEALDSVREDTAISAFQQLFLERGLPLAIRSDNGGPFASPNALFNLSKLSVWWLRLRLGIERIKPGRPQQNGRHERMHLTLKQEATRPPGMNSLQQQARFFMQYDLGYIDLEQKTLQPLDNPFGARLLPMS
jgi:transposase InsO family protein